ncbi:hypothetical protein EYF80_033689 [Liparis tanakae]|uniref:Uncharacterized protein n=1 Tax=Liparis tanakae TaxID=230148 RepID=A0A4Z2GQV6_9TELE|nr:hypothetical protein EYF80_033689 [Liparis tanakae]
MSLILQGAPELRGPGVLRTEEEAQHIQDFSSAPHLHMKVHTGPPVVSRVRRQTARRPPFTSHFLSDSEASPSQSPRYLFLLLLGPAFIRSRLKYFISYYMCVSVRSWSPED